MEATLIKKEVDLIKEWYQYSDNAYYNELFFVKLNHYYYQNIFILFLIILPETLHTICKMISIISFDRHNIFYFRFYFLIFLKVATVGWLMFELIERFTQVKEEHSKLIKRNNSQIALYTKLDDELYKIIQKYIAVNIPLSLNGISTINLIKKKMKQIRNSQLKIMSSRLYKFDLYIFTQISELTYSIFAYVLIILFSKYKFVLINSFIFLKVLLVILQLKLSKFSINLCRDISQIIPIIMIFLTSINIFQNNDNSQILNLFFLKYYIIGLFGKICGNNFLVFDKIQISSNESFNFKE